MNPRFDWMQSEDNIKRIILMRGVPSSGKSFRARELAGDTPEVICSADDFFEGETPEDYHKNWAGHLLRTAHNVCLKKARMSMQRQNPLVIIDNTNTLVRDMMPFVDMAVQYQYRIEIAEPTSSWWVNDIAPYLLDKQKNRKHLEKMAELLFEKNKSTHMVPLHAISRLLFRYHVNVTPEQLLNKIEKDLNDNSPQDQGQLD